MVNHPVRRRIVLQLMLLGAAGIVTSLTSLLLSFSGASGGQTAGASSRWWSAWSCSGCWPAAGSWTAR